MNKIRELQEIELEQYKKILEEVFNNKITLEEVQKNYEARKNDKNIHILGYFIDDKLVGTVTLNVIVLPSGKEATIWDVAVLKDYRRQGIAFKLMQQAENIAKKDKSISRIWLFSGFHRKEAHDLYKKLGYDENRDKAFVKVLKNMN